MTVSQNGYSANDRSVIGSYLVPGTSTRLAVRRGDVATVLLYVAARYNREVAPIDGAVLDDWGYAERLIRGSSSTVSNHASGTAIDLNAQQHPLGKRGTYTAAQVEAIRRIIHDCAGVVRAGEFYTSRVDGMHFEINASPAAVAALAARINGGSAPAPSSASTGRTVKVAAAATLGALAVLYGVSAADLQGANPTVAPSATVTPGTVLTLPPAAPVRPAAPVAPAPRPVSPATPGPVAGRPVTVHPATPAKAPARKLTAAQTARVKAVQRHVGVKADGIPGPKTKAAIARWQAAHRKATGHRIAVDGIDGPQSRKHGL